MNAVAFAEERVLFSPNIPAEVNTLLQTAVAASRSNQSRAESLFLEAKSLDATCLQTYFALYKFYFYQKRLEEAEREVLAGLEEASKQGGFPNDFRQIAQGLSQWNLYASEAGLFYLYTLKALAFIKLRQGYNIDAKLILEHMEILDPKDMSGVSVIRDLAQGMVD